MNILEIIKDKKYLCNSDFSYYRNIDQIKNNKLYFCAYGGGFVKTISLENKNFLNDEEYKNHISYIESENELLNFSDRTCEVRNWLNYIKN